MQFKELFGQKAKYNRLLRLSAPLVMSSSGYVLMQFTDAMFLSWYSPVAIAASGTAGMLSWLTTSLIIGTVSYTGTITANQVGAGQDDKIGSVNWQGLYLALFCGVITAFLGIGTDWFFKVIGHAEELRVLEAEYLKILLFGGALSFAQCSLSGFFSGRADNMRLMIAQLTGQIANVVMDYAMIFGKWGCPEMGVGGAAWATVLSNLFPLSMMLWWFFDHKNAERYKSRSDWRFRWSVAKQLLRFGLPSGFQMCMDAFLWTLFLLVIGRMGTVELAATTIAFRLNQLAFVPIFGVSRAISTLAGQSHGERNYKNALAYMGHGLVLCQIWMTFIAFTFAVFSRQYFMLFQSDSDLGGVHYSEVLAVGSKLMKLMATYTIADSINIALMSGLGAVGDTKWVFKVMAVATGLTVIAILLVDIFHWGLMTIWSFATIFIVSLPPMWYYRLRGGKWKEIRVAA